MSRASKKNSKTSNVAVLEKVNETTSSEKVSVETTFSDSSSSAVNETACATKQTENPTKVRANEAPTESEPAPVMLTELHEEPTGAVETENTPEAKEVIKSPTLVTTENKMSAKEKGGYLVAAVIAVVTAVLMNS